MNKKYIYNEATWLRAIIVAIPYIGGTIDMLFYKKGRDTENFIAGENLEEGNNCYLNVNDGKFYKTNASSEKTAGPMVVKALQKIKANKKGVFLVKGKYYSKNIERGVLFLSTEPGKLTSKMPTETDNVIRVTAIGLNTNEEYFSPSQDYMTHV
ncbi:MAG: hypothetical protein QG566_671 [Patescibacteria group bacterium]|nr:hypothetical protein [Patescibacteria group bacterium]